LMRRSAELARNLGVRLHTHLAETTNEGEYCQDRFKMSPYEFANSLDWLAPDVWLAHGVWTTGDDAVLLAKTGTAVTHCPSSSMMIGAGMCPVTDLLETGVTVGLGCDGSAAHDASDLWGEVRQAVLLAHLRGGPATFSARDALGLATRGSAACLGRQDIGS